MTTKPKQEVIDMSASETQVCHVCGELVTRTYRGYQLCDGCEWCLDEILLLSEDSLWGASLRKATNNLAVPEAL